MTRHLWTAALAGLASISVLTATAAAEPRDFLSGLYISEGQPARITPVVDVAGIVDNALRGNVPGIVANAVPPRYQGYVWGYYPWQYYVPRGNYSYYRYPYPRYVAPYPYGYYVPGYGGVYRNDNYDARYANPEYSVARPYSSEDVTGSTGRSIVMPPANPTSASEAAKVVNPATNGVTLSFVVDGQVYTVAPGESRELVGGPDRVITFDRGSSQGSGRYALRAGTYTFTATDKGWELYHTQPESQQGEVVPVPQPTLPRP